METVGNVVTAAKNAIWGAEDTSPSTTAATARNETRGQEPLSGEAGEGTLTDPFDRGNEQRASGETPISPDTLDSTPNKEKSTAGNLSDTLPTRESSSGNLEPSHTPQPVSSPTLSGVDQGGQSRPEAGTRPGDVRPTEANQTRPNINAGGFGTAEPSVSADPNSAQQPTPKHEGADRPMAAPTNDESTAVKESKAAGESAQTSSRSESPPKIDSEEQRQQLAAEGKLPKDPNDHSGEPMKMHGAKTDEGTEDVETDQQQRTARNQSVGQEGGHPHGQEKGTGEQWIKTSGLAADGGDFDATKPGAGKEATRLMEEKGIHRDEGNPQPSDVSPTNPADDSTAAKESKVQKLKEKLHIGSGKV